MITIETMHASYPRTNTIFLENKIKRETFFLFLVQCQSRDADNIIIDFLLDPSSPYLGGSISPVSGF